MSSFSLAFLSVAKVEISRRLINLPKDGINLAAVIVHGPTSLSLEVK